MNILLVILVVNALFWGLADHSTHCYLVGMKNCPAHYIHIIMGLVFYLASVYVSNKSYFEYLLS